MIRISFLTKELEDSERLAKFLMQERLVLYLTVEEHREIVLKSDGIAYRPLIHLSGMTKSLLYRRIQSEAQDLLKDRLVRTWAEAVTSLDPDSTNELMGGTMAV
ncbi:MAG: hypothetical protein KDB88_09475 [Flavobacteriales bacterium]|nr:hypothetical protein [Flavobacteriales bacterium]